jgi:hypothetical protein
MKDNYIQLGKSNVLTLKIKTDTGEFTGETLTFDLDDPDLLLKYQDLIEKDKKNYQTTRNKILIIEKQQDHKGKKLLSSNEEAKIRATSEFFKEEQKIFDMFLGEGGTAKLLNGRKFSWTTMAEIKKIILEQIAPYLEKTMDLITEQVKEEYGNIFDDKDEVLK